MFDAAIDAIQTTIDNKISNVVRLMSKVHETLPTYFRTFKIMKHILLTFTP